MAKKIDLSIIIVSFNTNVLTKECLDSVFEKIKRVNFEVIVVDNNSSDQSPEMLKKMSRSNKIKFIHNKKNVGFSAANNQGMKLAKGRYILLLNSDTKIKKNFFPEMIKRLQQAEDVGIASCALQNQDGTYQVSGGYFPNLYRVAIWMTIQDIPFVDRMFKPFHPKKAILEEKNLDWVTGAFFMIKKSVIDQIGYFDEDYFMYTEEVDYCYRAMKAGFKVLYLPDWSIIHYGGASSIKEFAILQETKGIKLFFRKHYPYIEYMLVRFFLKVGYFWRIFLISPRIYTKAFIEA